MTEQAIDHQPQPSEYSFYFGGGTGYSERRNNDVARRIGATIGRKIIPALTEPTQFPPEFTMNVNGIERTVSRKLAYDLAHGADVLWSISHFQRERATELLAHLTHETPEKVDAVFQSADALNGLIAANDDPSKFHTIVLAYPAGLVQPHNIKKAGLKVGFQDAVTRLKRKHRKAKREHSFEDRRRQRQKGRFTIISSVGLSKQNHPLHELRSKENAPGIAMVVGTDDVMLAPERVIASLESPNDIDIMLVVDTPHGINGRKDILGQTLDLFEQVEAVRHGDSARSLAERIRFAPDVTEARRQAILAVADERQATFEDVAINTK